MVGMVMRDQDGCQVQVVRLQRIDHRGSVARVDDGSPPTCLIHQHPDIVVLEGRDGVDTGVRCGPFGMIWRAGQRQCR